MKKHVYIKIVILIALLAVISLLIVACTDSSNTDNTEKKVDAFYTSGFTKGTLSTQNATDELMYGLFNTLKPVSEQKAASVQSSSLVVEAPVVIGSIKFVFSLKINYSDTEINQNSVLCEVYNADKNEILLSFYHVNDETNPMLYIRVGDTKLKIPCPINSMNLLAPVNTFETAVSITDIVKLKSGSEIKYEYKKENSTYTKHFLVNIDLAETLKALISNTKLPGSAFVDYASDLNFLLKNILGVTSSEISTNGLPSMYLSLECKTIEGMQDSYKSGRLSSMSVKLDVSASSVHTNTVFGGIPYTAKFDITEFKSSIQLINNIFEGVNFSEYTRYDELPLKLTLNFYFLSESTTRKYDFIAEIDYDNENINNTKASIRIYDNQTNKNRLSIYLENEVLWFNYLDKNQDKEINVKCSFDLQKIMEDILELSPSNQETSLINRAVAYVLGALSIYDQNSIRYAYDIENLKTLLGIDNNKIAEIINSSTAGIGEDSSKSFYDLFGTGNFEQVIALKVQIQLSSDEPFITNIDEVVLPDEEDRNKL
ncbi:MAG: hypothetical protein LBF12_03810 [Christensenellaceae bacterium]|jgi:hypothetical protein|nr:hypothetical protein [Christensenellaceae bacterium]